MGPGNPAEWQSAAPMADQDPARMSQYMVGQLCDPQDMPTPDTDVTSGVVDRRNLPDYEHTWN
eukprot:5022796-Lingulodinium_polyedra.AAC.1